MRRAPLDSSNSPCGLDTADLPFYIADWLSDNELRGHSQATLATRKDFLSKLQWFAHRNGHNRIGTPELRAFLLYLSHGHEEEGVDLPR